MAPKATKRKVAPKKAKATPVDAEIDDLELDDVEEEAAPAPVAKRKKKASVKPAPVADDSDDDDEDDEPAPKPIKKSKKKAKAAPVVEEDDDDEDDEDDEPAPVKKATKKKAKAAAKPKKDPIEFGTNWLVQHVNDTVDSERVYTQFDLRALLRKAAKQGLMEREVGQDRSRYEFSGPNDKVVKALIKMVESGDVERGKKESLETLKKNSAAKKAAAGTATPPKKKGKGKPKAKPVVVEEEDDEDDDDLDELDD